MNQLITNRKNPLFKGVLLGLLMLLAFIPISNSWAATYVTSGAINPNTGNPLPWSNRNAWLVNGATPTRIPISTDDVIINHTITIPANSGSYFCNSIVFNGNSTANTLTIGSGVLLEVSGDVSIKSPSLQDETNFINMPQGNLIVNGNLWLGEIPNNGFKGNAAITVGGNSTTYGTLTVKGSITNVSTFSSPACAVTVNGFGILEIGGTLSHGSKLAATLNGNSTLRFNGTNPQFLPTSVTYGNLHVANTAGVFLSEALSATNLLGNLVIESGKLENNALSIAGRPVRDMEVKDGARLVLTGASTFPGGFGNIDLAPTSTVAYSGTANQNVAARTYGYLELTGGAGRQKVLLGNVVAGNTIVNADLMLDLGGLTIGENTLTLKASGSIRNPGQGRYIVLAGMGKMIVENMGPTGRNAEIAFPVGTATSYTPAYIKNTGATNHFSVGVEDGVKDYATNTPLNYNIVKKTWDIKQESANGTPNVELRLQWNSGDEAADFDNKNCYVTHYTNNAWTKSDMYQDATQNGMSVRMTGITSFSPFGVADGGNPLPVELVFFNAVKRESQVALTWETASEKNNKGFEVQASADGRNFEAVGFVASKNGNANYSQRYEFSDKTSRSGLVYYRLKQMDLDGTVSYYAAKVIDMGRFAETIAAYPNPFQSRFDVKVEAGAAQEIMIRITDLTGKTVYQSAAKVQAGQNVIPVEMGQNLPAGMYIMTAKTASQTYTSRMVKQ